MARAPSPLYGTGQARGQQLQEHGQDLECFWENAGAGRTCPIPTSDTDTEGTCCSSPTGTAGPSSPTALPGEGAPGSFLVLVNKSLLTPAAAGTRPPAPMSFSTGCTGPAVVSVPFPKEQGEFFGGLGVFLLLLRNAQHASLHLFVPHPCTLGASPERPSCSGSGLLLQIFFPFPGNWEDGGGRKEPGVFKVLLEMLLTFAAIC